MPPALRRPGEAALVCILVLALAMAAPAAEMAWLRGGHATPEQARVHTQALADGNAEHHGGGASGSADPGDPPNCEVGAQLPALTFASDGVYVRAGAAAAWLSPDAPCSIGPTISLTPLGLTWLLELRRPVPATQVMLPPPHPPPIRA